MGGKGMTHGRDESAQNVLDLNPEDTETTTTQGQMEG